MILAPAAALFCWLLVAPAPWVVTKTSGLEEPTPIEWLPTFAAAQAKAKASTCPIFLVVNMDGERANDKMVEVVYQDPGIRELVGSTAPVFLSRFDHSSGDDPCPRAGSVTCAEHQAAEKGVRREFLKTDDRGEVIAPQHVLIDPDGEVLLLVPYQISVGELEWCLVTAIQTVDRGFRWKLSEKARAPKRLIQGGADQESTEPDSPPDRKEVTLLIKAIRSGKKPWKKIEEIRRLISSPEKKAVEYAEDLLHLLPPGNKVLRGRLLHDIGRYSPAGYRKVVEPYLQDEEASVRAEAAVALEQMRSVKSVKALLKQWKREKNPAVRIELLHALPVCGPGDKSVVKVISSAAAEDGDGELRVAALVGAASLDSRAVMTELVQAGFQDPVAEVRIAAAWVVGVAIGDSFESELMEAGAAEVDAAARAVIEEVWKILNDEAPRERLGKLARELEPDLIPRDR